MAPAGTPARIAQLNAIASLADRKAAINADAQLLRQRLRIMETQRNAQRTGTTNTAAAAAAAAAAVPPKQPSH